MEDLKRRAAAAMDAINDVSDEINTIIAQYNELLSPITLTWWPGGPRPNSMSLASFCIDDDFVVGWAMTPCKKKLLGRQWQLVICPTHLLMQGTFGEVKPLAESSRYIRNRAVAHGIVDAVAREVVKHAEKVAAETVAAAEAVRELNRELG